MTEKQAGGDKQPIHPLERLKKRAEELNQRREKEIVYCPECNTEVLKDSVEAAVDTAETHDESRHNGEQTTEVNGVLLPQFSEKEIDKIKDAVRRLDTDN